MRKFVILEDADDIDNFGLWSGAADRWNTATDEQKEAVYDRLCDYEMAGNEIPQEDVCINDFIWFECDDIFFPEENAEDDEQEEDAEDERK